jgi:hypothetical protein
MDPSRFDELTKTLATPISRRQALKTLAASAFGGLLAFSGLDRAFARTGRCPPGLKLCHGKCVNPRTDPKNCGVCGVVCASGLCVNGLCCPPGTICQNGQCVTPPCTSGCFNSCNSSGTCYCNNTTGGTPACVQPFCLTGPCTSSAQCPSGSICSTQGCCGSQPFCIPLCNTPSTGTSVRKYGAAS